MANQNCTECNNEYDPETLNLPSPLLDNMCAVCGTVLTQQEVEQLMQEHMSNQTAQ